MTSWSSGDRDANGITAHYLRTGGGGPPIVMLHGLLSSGACWTPVARMLDHAHDVLMPDARGHGGSSAPVHGYRYDDLADDVEGFVNALALAPPVLLGHSMGGMTAAVVAGRGALPLRGLVLVDPTFLSPERQREVYASDVAAQHRAMLERSLDELVVAARVRSPERSLELVELQAAARLRTSMAALEVLAPPNPDSRALVRAIAVPTLLVIGDAPVVTLEIARELRELNPRVRLAQVANAGHGLPFDQPERLGELVLAFVRGL